MATPCTTIPKKFITKTPSFKNITDCLNYSQVNNLILLLGSFYILKFLPYNLENCNTLEWAITALT